jgi:hypothetical protein
VSGTLHLRRGDLLDGFEAGLRPHELPVQRLDGTGEQLAHFTHIVLAISIAFLVPRTFLLALRGNFERHRRWARWTFPIWYYVSITGVLVYFFLYQWWPATRSSTRGAAGLGFELWVLG